MGLAEFGKNKNKKSTGLGGEYKKMSYVINLSNGKGP